MMNGRPMDFYERNNGEPVNLYTEKGNTLSGDITEYDRSRGVVILSNVIIRKYNPDGTSRFMESDKEIELNVPTVAYREATTREDRLGRIVKYNQDLEMEELETKLKLKNLREKAREKIFNA